MTIARVALASVTALTLATAALAQGTDPQARPDGPREVTVPFADLDLSAPRDAVRMAGRIRAAAEAVCGPAPSILDLDGAATFERCRRDAAEQALARLNAPAVVMAYRGRTPPAQVAKR